MKSGDELLRLPRPARLLIPGVPTAGHIDPAGYWHPGRVQGCSRCRFSEPGGSLLP